MPIINFNFAKDFFELFIRDWSWYAHNLRTFFSISTHCHSMLTKQMWSWLLTFLVIARSDLSCWKLSLSLRTSSANFVSEDSILFYILSIIAINSCSLSLLRDSSVKDAMHLNNKNKPSYKRKLKMIKLFKIMKFYIRLHIYLLSSICSICSESLKNRVKRLIFNKVAGVILKKIFHEYFRRIFYTSAEHFLKNSSLWLLQHKSSKKLSNTYPQMFSKNRERQFCLIYKFFSFCYFRADAASAFNLNLYLLPIRLLSNSFFLRIHYYFVGIEILFSDLFEWSSITRKQPLKLCFEIKSFHWRNGGKCWGGFQSLYHILWFSY